MLTFSATETFRLSSAGASLVKGAPLAFVSIRCFGFFFTRNRINRELFVGTASRTIDVFGCNSGDQKGKKELGGPVIKEDNDNAAIRRNGSMINRWHMKLCAISRINCEWYKRSSREQSPDLSDHTANLMPDSAQSKLKTTKNVDVVCLRSGRFYPSVL